MEQTISVIVPVYKVEAFLRQCIDSIVNQTYRHLEILLVDDGSPDDCGKICDEYAEKDNRIRVFHTSNQGLSSARNFGLQNAAGEFVSFVDSDDWLEPDMYETLLERMEAAGADVSVCGYWFDSVHSSLEIQLENAVYTGNQPLQALIEKKFPISRGISSTAERCLTR